MENEDQLSYSIEAKKKKIIIVIIIRDSKINIS